MEYVDMTIQEIEEVLKDYTCEFIDDGKTYYYLYNFDGGFFYIGHTKNDFTRGFYFESEEKISDFYKKVGNENVLKYLKYVYKDFILDYNEKSISFRNRTTEIKHRLKYYMEDEYEGYGLTLIRPFKEQTGTYKIRYIDLFKYSDEDESNLIFESFNKAKKAVEGIGEYEILKYYFGIDESLIKDKNDISIDYLIEVRNNLSKLIERVSDGD